MYGGLQKFHPSSPAAYQASIESHMWKTGCIKAWSVVGASCTEKRKWLSCREFRCRIIVIKGYHNFFNLKVENHTAGERILPLGGEIYLIRSRSFSGSLFVRNCYPDGMRRFENDEAFIMAFLCQSAFVLWKTYEAIINRDSCRQLCRVRLEYLPKEDVWTWNFYR